MWKSNNELKLTDKILIPKYLKMPKPLVKYSREKIDKEFYSNRINDITLLIHNRRDIRLFLTFCIWLQTDCPETLNELNHLIHTVEKNSVNVRVKDLRHYLSIINEKVNMQQLPGNILELYNANQCLTKDPQSAQFIKMNKQLLKLVVQIALHLDTPIDPTWDFIEDIFVIPKPIKEEANNTSDLWTSEKFEILNEGARHIIKLIYDTFWYFSMKFSGIQEHFLKMASTLFWCTKPEPVYSLEIYSLLREMFGEHKLNSRSSQLCDKCNCNELIICGKKVGSKNRSAIYFTLAPGAEWIIVTLFPDKKAIIQQQALALSFLRYSKQILTAPWTINPMNFNYLMDIWFKSFLYSDNFNEIVYEKARELRREISY